MAEQGTDSEPTGNAQAIALGIAAGRASHAVDEEVIAYLRDQRHHLHEQLKQIHLDITEKWLGVFLRLATLCVGVAAAAGVTLMVWDAWHSNGLLIEPFSVPPDMAAKGLTGQVVASQVLDKLTTMDAATQSFRPPLSYANNWGKDIKVEIPETGVSIGEVQRFLREWLGNDLHISGEVWRTDTGLALSARTGGERGATFTGTPSDFDALVQKAAEHVYSQTQPYRYASYVRSQGRLDEARAMYLLLTESGSQLERGWAWQGLATAPAPTGSPDQNADWALRKAIAAYPDYTLAHTSLAGTELSMGHPETALAEEAIVARLLARSTIPDIDPAFIPLVKKGWAWRRPMLLGDYAEVIALTAAGMELPDQAAQREVMRQARARALALSHDGGAARAFFRQRPPINASQISPATAARRAVIGLLIEAACENWGNAMASGAAAEQAIDEAAKRRIPGAAFDPTDMRLVAVYPWLALAKAKSGDIAGAQAVIAATPGDCYDCVRVRAVIAAQARQDGRADYWFARAVRQAPSLPMAYSDWGAALLARGDAGGAIAKFTIANQKGPHFADALELWGEALMAQKNPDAALEKFAEADKYAPNWGRMHLKWGEALAYAGSKDEAKAQFARAAGLELSPADKAELAKEKP